MKKLYALLFIFTFTLRVWQTTGCINFTSYKFSAQSITATVEEQTHVDAVTQNTTSRIFHNKASVGITELGKSYLKFFEPRFILEVVGPFGLILLIFAALNATRIKSKKSLVHLAAVGAVPLIAIMIPNSKMAFFIVALAFASFAAYGANALTFNKKILLITVMLTIINIWYFAFSWQMLQICNEIFFH